MIHEYTHFFDVLPIYIFSFLGFVYDMRLGFLLYVDSNFHLHVKNKSIYVINKLIWVEHDIHLIDFIT